MKDNVFLVGIVLIFLGCVICLDKWLFESVVATDWPNWVKYMVLK